MSIKESYSTRAGSCESTFVSQFLPAAVSTQTTSTTTLAKVLYLLGQDIVSLYTCETFFVDMNKYRDFIFCITKNVLMIV